MPLLRLAYEYTDNDRAMGKWFSKKTRKTAEKIGTDIINTNEEQGNFNVNKDTNTNNTGGVIMGADPATSALNKYQ